MTETLDDRFRMHVSSNRSAPPRQRTLRAAIDWSYELLDEDERTLFGVVSSFDGGCSLEAAASIATARRRNPLMISSAECRIGGGINELGGISDSSWRESHREVRPQALVRVDGPTL